MNAKYMYRILFGKSEGKALTGRPGCSMEDNIKR
jgi:hypothetical protein